MKLWRGQPDHNHWKRPFTARERAVAWWGLAACFGLLALSDWVSPKQPPFSGKWGWLYSWAYSAFGPYGIVGLEAVVAGLLLAVGVAYWFRRDSESRDGIA